MNSKQSLLITTTDTVEGRRTLEYLGPIAVHVVAGTGFFSDFAAGLTDLLGGRSGTYQRQLEGLQTSVIDALGKRARVLRANAVVGLRIDYDEISGKNKQMFMVTATGTAVRLDGGQASVESDADSDVVGAGDIDPVDVEVEMFRRRVGRRIASGSLALTDAMREFATAHAVTELAAPTVDRIVMILEMPATQRERAGADEVARWDRFMAESREYFAVLPRDVAATHLYDLFVRSHEACAYSRGLIRDLQLTDFARIREFIDHVDLTVRARSLELLRGHPKSYAANDLSELEHILLALRAGPLPPAERIASKKIMRSEETIVWVCDCKAKVPDEEQNCSSCGRDEHGFKKSELNIARAIELVEQRLEALRSLVEAPA